MNQNRQNIFKPVYYFQRPVSPKNLVGQVQSSKNLSLTMSIGAKQAHNFFPGAKPKKQTSQQQQTSMQNSAPLPGDRYEKLENEMKHIAKQNNYLKEENDFLKKQLMRYKKQNTTDNVRSVEKYPVSSGEVYNDLRGTIKKQSGEIRQLKLKLDMVSKQCKMYEQMIDKMDQRIKKLVNDQHKKTVEIDELRQELSKIDQLKDKTNSVLRLYNELESKFNSDQLEWMKWKQNWLAQKEYYMNIIHELEKNNNEGHYS